jgi:hypothetical protein
MELKEYFATQETVNKKRYGIISRHSAEGVTHKF